MAMALGRYFVVADPRHGDSALAQAIITFKVSDEPANDFAKLLAGAMKRLGKVDTHPYVVSVPPKPKQRNRFGKFDESARQEPSRSRTSTQMGFRACVIREISRV